MKCIGFEIQNFMGIGSADLDLSDKGLVAIQGVNLDDSSANSNGAGKSSLADALFWCLFGETARDGLGADEVVNRKVGKDCIVKTTWEDDKETFVITRWRKAKSMGKTSGVSLTWVSGTDFIDLTKGTDKLTQVEIEKALGCTKEVFQAAVYAGQEKLPNLPAMSDGELKQLIEKASGVDVLVAAYKVAREKLKEAENDQDRWRMNHVRLERDVTQSKDRLDNLNEELGTYERKRDGNIASLMNELTQHVKLAKDHQAKRDDIKIATLDAEIAKLDAKIESVKEEQIEEDNLAADEREARTALTTFSAHYNRAKDDALRQKKKLDEIDNQVGTPCAECGKPFEAHDLGKIRKIAEDQLRALVARAKELKTDVEAQEKILSGRSQNLAQHRAARTDISKTVTERSRLAELLAVRKRAEDAMVSETNAAKRVKAQIDKLKAESNPFIALVEGCKKELDDAGVDYRKSEEDGVDVEKRIMVAKDVVKVFGPAGVRAHILDAVTPYLNDRTSDYLSAMSDGNISAIWSTLSLNAKGDLVEKFAIAVQKEEGGGSFASLSGGEKRKVRLSCALALQDLVATRATKSIELWVGDEIDDAMDDAGLERLMSILEQKARERGTVVVISHNAITDFIRDVATVTMENGLSTVAGALAA